MCETVCELSRTGGHLAKQRARKCLIYCHFGDLRDPPIRLRTWGGRIPPGAPARLRVWVAASSRPRSGTGPGREVPARRGRRCGSRCTCRYGARREYPGRRGLDLSKGLDDLSGKVCRPAHVCALVGARAAVRAEQRALRPPEQAQGTSGTLQDAHDRALPPTPNRLGRDGVRLHPESRHAAGLAGHAHR